MKSRIVLEAVLIALLGIMIGFLFNYARKDGVSIIKKPIQVEKSQVSNRVESSVEDPVELVWIDLEEAIRHFEEGDAVFIDSREEEEYQEGHIQGSVSVPYEWFLDERPDISYLIPDHKIIITYCSGSECESSVELAYVMWERGYGGIKIFLGGWQAWIENSLPAEGEQ